MVTRANMYHAIMHMPSGSLLPASSSLNIDISEHSSLHHSNLKGQLIVSLVVTLLTLKAIFTDAGSTWADLLLRDCIKAFTELCPYCQGK